ncbi:TetR/AcrR family transcriptional regulator [Mycobacterium sp. Aquia_216]|uniref:TetR/AcrR family transcriptional regulator n=1 Tax=Mycobacterium sp. Aquia_216 TaxID=2991729 RepID=UPI00227C57CB|nr:TetR/AcrR family transcriptional regulator [Mycobacterium sp. Aquia_216]WAJ44346.1 TetR/AcrR family transcriptional regulator [Mycobacterium sp. Aquia_216]
MTAGKRQLQARKQPRQRRSEEMRHRILDAATRVFAQYGYTAGTTNRIAESAGISIGSLYQYYPNKDAILLELATRHLDAGVATDLRLRTPNPSPSLHDVISAMVRSNIENHRADPELLRVLIEQAPRSDELMAKVAEVEGARMAHLRNIMKRSPEVTIDDEEVAARLVVSTIEMVVHHLLAAPDAIDLERLETQLVEMLYRYLTATPPNTPECE